MSSNKKYKEIVAEPSQSNGLPIGHRIAQSSNGETIFKNPGEETGKIIPLSPVEVDLLNDRPTITGCIYIEVEEGKAEPSERDILKAKAKDLGLEYPKNIKTPALKTLIEEAE